MLKAREKQSWAVQEWQERGLLPELIHSSGHLVPFGMAQEIPHLAPTGGSKRMSVTVTPTEQADTGTCLGPSLSLHMSPGVCVWATDSHPPSPVIPMVA